MFEPVAIDLVTASRQNPPTLFLRAIFDGLSYDGFSFPTSGRDGCIGNFCISKAQRVNTPGGNLDFHLNFACTPGNYRRGALNLAIEHFHLTARSAREQMLINDAGPSQLTAATSVHINRNGDWGRAPNLAALAASLNMTVAALLETLTRREGYTRAYMRVAAQQIREVIERTVGINAGQTRLTWNRSDGTFD